MIKKRKINRNRSGLNKEMNQTKREKMKGVGAPTILQIVIMKERFGVNIRRAWNQVI